MSEDRLQKILASLGYGSRRVCEEFIRQGRVSVNGKVTQLGDKADISADRIELDGKQVRDRVSRIYIALYKPRKYLSVIDRKDDRPNVQDITGINQHVFPIGRLDFDSEGLILLTNDGELANRLTHPRYGHEKQYHVQVKGKPDDKQLAIWRRGVVLEDGYRTQPALVDILRSSRESTWLDIAMKEGRKRQIREVGLRIGLPVLRIIRVRIGSIQLGTLKAGEWRYLTRPEIASLEAVEGPLAASSPQAKS